MPQASLCPWTDTYLFCILWFWGDTRKCSGVNTWNCLQESFLAGSEMPGMEPGSVRALPTVLSLRTHTHQCWISSIMKRPKGKLKKNIEIEKTFLRVIFHPLTSKFNWTLESSISIPTFHIFKFKNMHRDPVYNNYANWNILQFWWSHSLFYFDGSSDIYVLGLLLDCIQESVLVDSRDNKGWRDWPQTR